MTAQDYAVSFGYGAQDGYYYGPNGIVGPYHKGNDRPTPSGTPIVINGTTIGHTGATGMVSGAHLHTQAWTGSTGNTQNPSPFEFQPGVVVGTGTASQWGNFVTVTVNGVNLTYCHLSQINVSNGQNLGTPTNSGGSMNDDTSRQIAYHYLGRHGFDGRPNGLASPQELQGRPLTNQELSTIFLSEESRAWRDQQLPNLFAERDSLRVQVSSLNGQVSAQAGTITELSTQVASQQSTITDQQQTINGQKVEIAELQDENAQLKKQVEDLKAQVAAGGNDVTINFNNFGVIIWTVALALIKAVGYKKG